MRTFKFSNRNDVHNEPIDVVQSDSRLVAAKYFARKKNLSLKDFLKIFKVNK